MKKTVCIIKNAKIDDDFREDFRKAVTNFIESPDKKGLVITLSGVTSKAEIEFKEINVNISLLSRIKRFLVG